MTSQNIVQIALYLLSICILFYFCSACSDSDRDHEYDYETEAVTNFQRSDFQNIKFENNIQACLNLTESRIYPNHDKIYLFENSTLRTCCRYPHEVNLSGNISTGELIESKQEKFNISEESHPYKFGSTYVKPNVKIGESGWIKCSSRDPYLIHVWHIKTLDIKNNPVLQLNLHSNNEFVCRSRKYPLRTLEFVTQTKTTKCSKKTDSLTCLNQVEIIRGRNECKGVRAKYSLCLKIRPEYGPGIIRCSSAGAGVFASYQKVYEAEAEPLWNTNTYGIASAILIAVTGVGIGIIIRCRRTYGNNVKRNLTEREVQEFLKGNPEAFENEIEIFMDAYEVVHHLPYDRRFEIPREKLFIDTAHMLGNGQFGKVYQGRVADRSETVAIKTVKDDCDICQYKGFLKELKIMIYIGNHPNIVSLIGASTEKIKEKTLHIVVEYCSNGSLESYLRKHKDSFIDLIENDKIVYNTNEGTISTYDLVKWSFQIANAMEYIAQKKVIHADLAARNILIDSKGNAKITDFGLSRQLYSCTKYTKMMEKSPLLPWRWMAIESLQQLKFSTQSDVWSYGILLFEIFSVGELPSYNGLTWGCQFLQELKNGLRLTKPAYCTSEIYKIMFECWKVIPEQRPSFNCISRFFKSLMQPVVETEYAEIVHPNSNNNNNLNPLPGYSLIANVV